jgi:hypothetical protein
MWMDRQTWVIKIEAHPKRVYTRTVFLSLVAHGMSANPLAKWIGRKEQQDA